MKSLIFAFFILIGLACTSTYSNPIDDNCPQLSYKHAPIISADQYICHTEYAIALSYTTRNPIYTTEYLAADHTGDLPRPRGFKPDPEVPSQYAVKTEEYTDTTCHSNPCDRGHMTPDQDFSACDVCLHESFYTSNIVPQNKRNNEIIWKSLEVHIRSFVASHGPVYVITGPAYGQTPDHIGNGIYVPDSLFKVVIDANSGDSTAFMMPNEDLPTKSLPQREVSLSDIETATGITFDSSLDKHQVGVLKILH